MCVAAKREDMGVVSGDDGQGVIQRCHVSREADGEVHLYRLVQRLLGFSLVMPVVNASA